MRDSSFVDRCLNVIQAEILPLTTRGVELVNKIFGAAILAKSESRTICAASNAEIENPLFHGEIACLNIFWAMPRDSRPRPSDCFFLSTHEPCSLCLSAITWSGFDNFTYAFRYSDSRDTFRIPHDLNILKEVFNCDDGSYTGDNAYWKSQCLIDLIDRGSEDERMRWSKHWDEIHATYTALSEIYQRQKSTGDIPLR